jgi:hypothetical protein
MLPEYTKFDAMGVSFTAFDKEADSMTPQSWCSTTNGTYTVLHSPLFC